MENLYLVVVVVIVVVAAASFYHHRASCWQTYTLCVGNGTTHTRIIYLFFFNIFCLAKSVCMLAEQQIERKKTENIRS